uniref:Uncharacterized protein n=1 Tax=Arundo donax TaxID=35708 RepID=A0A0A9BHJ0_ARUDO
MDIRCIFCQVTWSISTGVLCGRDNYLLSGALDAGLAFMAALLYLCLGLDNISLNWWGKDFWLHVPPQRV